MKPRDPCARLLFATLVVSLLSALLVAWDWQAQGTAAERQFEFQSLLRGLGAGPHLDLHFCENCFDPRLAPRCVHTYDPLPGGDAFCAHHSLSIFATRPLETGEPSARGVNDARSD